MRDEEGHHEIGERGPGLLRASNVSSAIELLLADPCVKNTQRHPQESSGASGHRTCWHVERTLREGSFPQNPFLPLTSL
jgi:hypothetical protein